MLFGRTSGGILVRRDVKDKKESISLKGEHSTKRAYEVVNKGIVGVSS